jgi:hypothetical protein
MLHVDGANFQTMTLGIVDDHGRGVKAHWLIVEQRVGTRYEVMELRMDRVRMPYKRFAGVAWTISSPN